MPTTKLQKKNELLLDLLNMPSDTPLLHFNTVSQGNNYYVYKEQVFTDSQIKQAIEKRKNKSENDPNLETYIKIEKVESDFHLLQNTILVVEDQDLNSHLIINTPDYYTSNTSISLLLNLESSLYKETKQALSIIQKKSKNMDKEPTIFNVYPLVQEVQRKFEQNDMFIGMLLNILLPTVYDNTILFHKLEKLKKYIFLLYKEDTYHVGVSKAISYYMEQSILGNQDKFDYTLEALYDLLKSTYATASLGFEAIKPAFKLTYDPEYETVKNNLNQIKPLLDENNQLKIYRGRNSKSIPSDKALSWTLSPSIAYNFATRYFDEEFCAVDVAYIPFEGILDTIINDSPLERNELEILVNPNLIQIIGDECQYQKTNVLEELSESPLDDLNDKPEIMYYIDDFCNDYQSLAEQAVERLIDLVENYEADNGTPLFSCSDIHGESHTKRVIYHATNLARLQGLTAREIDIVLTSAILHDIGRINDMEDDMHGTYSVQKFMDYLSTANSSTFDENAFLVLTDEQDIRIAKELMIYHCKGDEALDRKWLHAIENAHSEKEKSQLQEEYALTRRLYNVLCDADGLERIRLNDIDNRYFRLKETPLLTVFAYGLLLATSNI